VKTPNENKKEKKMIMATQQKEKKRAYIISKLGRK